MFNPDEPDQQQELFQDYAQISPKPRKSGFSLAKIYLSLSYENLFIIGIGLVMLFIVCYSLGVERGKQLVQLKSENIEVFEPKVQEKPAITVSPVQPAQPPKKIRVKVAQGTLQPLEPAPQRSSYIQVGTFTNDRYAEKELARLKNKGYTAFTTKQGKYRVVYVGNYQSKNEAARALQELRKLYADCILRNR